MSGPAGFRDSWLTTSCSVITVLQPRQVVVWLLGEIDVAAAGELEVIASQVPRVRDRLVVDLSGVSFCDVTLARFIAISRERVEVRVRNPPRLARDLISLTMSPARARIAAPRRPAAIGSDR